MEISTLIEIVSLFSPLLVFLRSSCFLIAIADLAFAYTLFIHSICVFYCDLGIVFYPRYKMEKKTIITFIFIEFSKGYRHNQFIKNKLQPMKSYLSWIELESCHSCDWKKFNVPCCCSVIELCLTLWDPIDCSTQGFAVLHCLMCIELVMLSNHLILGFPPPPSLPALSLSQHQSLFQWVNSSHQVAKVLELQLQHQSLPWIFRVDLL